MGSNGRQLLLGGARRLSDLALCALEVGLFLVFLAARGPLAADFAGVPPALLQAALWGLFLASGGLAGWGGYTLRGALLARLEGRLSPEHEPAA